MSLRSAPRHVFALVAAVVGTAALARSGVGLAGENGTIRGQVDLRRTQVTLDTRPAAAALGASPRRPVELRPAVVYLDPAPGGALEGDGTARATMDQRDETFVPHVLAITVGTIVDFPNSDLTFHNVFSLSRTRTFDLGRYSQGKSKSVRFDRPGVVQVFCDIHSHMSAYILVFAHRYFAVTDKAGSFSITGIPPGTYTLAAWHEGDVRENRTVTIPESGGTIEAAFVLR